MNKKYYKGDYNQKECEIWDNNNEYIGIVRTSDADIFIELLNKLNKENQDLEQLLKLHIEFIKSKGYGLKDVVAFQK